jgi:hypothetical protein
MDAAEAIVKRSLVAQNFQSIVHEPDGNVPPDFLADGRIAIEVRRLNIHHVEQGRRTYSHQEKFYPIWQGIESMLPQFGLSLDGESWYVDFTLRHPMKSWKVLKPAVVKVLNDFQKSGNRVETNIRVLGNIDIGFIRCGNLKTHFYVMGGGAEDEMGCLVVGEIHRNVEIIAREKAEKIKNIRHRYEEWWLALVDGIGHGISNDDYAQLISIPRDRSEWSKVLLINPSKPESAFEI